MTTVKHLPVGEEIYYFDPVREGEIKIDKGENLGAYIHKSEGELWYYTPTKEIPAYAAAATLEEIKQKAEMFLAYRAHLQAVQAEIQSKYRELRKDYIYPEFAIEQNKEQGE